MASCDRFDRAWVVVIVGLLAGQLAGQSTPPDQGIYVVPQSHIDVAWFWRYDPETLEVCIPMTFGRAIDVLDRCKDYVFVASQVPLYEGLRRHYPELAAKVASQIRQGRWEVVGGHFVEFEGTGPSGESMVRQCVYGKRYFREVWGVDVRSAWQVDSWTHTWTVPQILVKSEMDSYCFLRGFRGENAFWWESPDGSRVLAYRPTWTREDLKPAQELLKTTKSKHGVGLCMGIVGEGDHGGGITPAVAEQLRRNMASAGVPTRFSRYDTFLAALLKAKKDWPVLRDELGFELEGCQSNAGPLKAANRRCENLLIEAEKTAAISAALFGTPYPKSDLKARWFDVLHNQFHDTISGCVVPAGYQDALELYAGAEGTARRVRREATDRLSGAIDTRGQGIPVVVFNSLSWQRTGPVEVELQMPSRPEALTFVDAQGHSTPGQILGEAAQDKGVQIRCLFVARQVPGVGYKTFWAQSAAPGAGASGGPVVADRRIENEAFLLETDPKSGDVVRLFDKRNSRELLPPGGHANRIDIIEETGDSEGRLKWGTKTWALEPLATLNGWRVVERGPVRVTVRVRNTLKQYHTAFDRFISLTAGMPWVEFRTHAEWNSTGKYVKLAFPTPYRQAKPTFEIPYGSITREADGAQRPALNWVDLGDAAHGLSLINDCRNGHDVRDGVIRIDMIRSPIEPAHNTDCGHQEMTYALYPHSGDWRSSGTVRRGHEFNTPLLALPTVPHEGRLPSQASLVTIDRANVIVSVIKEAEDSKAMVLRLYETDGQRCTAAVRLDRIATRTARLTNLLERPLSDLKVNAESGDARTIEVPMGPFEINTVIID